MFAKTKETKKISNDISTIIGQDTTVEGTLKVDSSIRIDGKVYGNVISSGDVTIGKDGYVEKEITARNLFIAGKVKGSVKIENKIHIYDTGFLDGSAEMNAIVIDENGYFCGQSIMTSRGEEALPIKTNKKQQKQVQTTV